MYLLVEACSMQKCRSVVGYAVLLAVLLSKLVFVCAREQVFVNGKTLMLLCLADGIKNTLGGQRALARKALSGKPLVDKENSEEQWKAKAIVT